jgi:hypothetical protein
MMTESDVHNASHMEPLCILKKFIHCKHCNKVFNAEFTMAKKFSGQQSQTDPYIIVKYQYNGPCPTCKKPLMKKITATWRVDSSTGAAYNCCKYVFTNDELISDVRSKIYKPITCAYCRRRFNTTYTLSKLPSFWHTRSKAVYKCKTQCPTCDSSIIDNISDYYYSKDCHTVCYERGVYSDEEKVPDNMHDFESIAGYNCASCNIINEHKGDCLIVVVGTCVIIYDFGYKKYFSNVCICLQEAYESSGIHIVFLILSHNDQDHREGLPLVISYLKGLNPSPQIFAISPCSKSFFSFYAGVIVIADKTKFGTIPLKINFDGQMMLQVVYPKHKDDQDNNRNSLVAAVFVNKKIILLTGDQHFDGIDFAMEALNITKSTVFQIPHHGSSGNFNGYTELVPSRWYIVSGTPMKDSEGVVAKNYEINKKCQENIANKLLGRNLKKPIYLILTQPRISPKLEKQLQENKINIIKVNHTSHFSIKL